MYSSLYVSKVVQACDKCSPSRFAGACWVSGCPQDHLGLLKGILAPQVPPELKEAHVSRQVELTDATQYP
jgi:hypothetical protein